ncbi:MAG: glycosyltransferase family 29 protein, partial [Atribacterota bacterium]
MDLNFSNFVKGNSAVLVGPAKSIEGSNQGEMIDSFNLVVRMNKAVPVPDSVKEDIGSRTDILYNCLE